MPNHWNDEIIKEFRANAGNGQGIREAAAPIACIRTERNPVPSA